jgi:membrane-associated protein
MGMLELLMNFFEVHYYLAYLILFLGSFVEILVGVNFFVYGEFFFLSGAILAGAGILNIWLVAIVCISGGI